VGEAGALPARPRTSRLRHRLQCLAARARARREAYRRHLSFEVFPFSYAEYLAYRGEQPGAGSLRGYLDEGGFPATCASGTHRSCGSSYETSSIETSGRAMRCVRRAMS